MMTDDSSPVPSTDHLSNEVSLGTAFDKQGFSIKGKSRALAAVDRLAGALFDIPAAYLDRVGTSVRDTTARTTALQNAETRLILDFVAGDDAYGKAIVNGYLASRIPKVSNKLHVLRGALEHLAAEPPIEDADGASDTLDEDWLNHLDAHAERASSERVRDLWARVLAGEIRSPRSFSLATLRLLSELDATVAAVFERETVHRLELGCVLRPENEALVDQRLEDLSFLEEVGLFQSVRGFTVAREPVSGYVHWREGDWVLACRTKATLRLQVIGLTRVGREIAGILPPPDPLEVLERIAERLADRVKSREIRPVPDSVQEADSATSRDTIYRRLKVDADWPSGYTVTDEALHRPSGDHMALIVRLADGRQPGFHVIPDSGGEPLTHADYESVEAACRALIVREDGA